jgi:hypothetical protein
MAEPGLGCLDIYARRDELSGVGPAKVVESGTGNPGSRDSWQPHPSAPVRVVKGLRSGVVNSKLWPSAAVKPRAVIWAASILARAAGKLSGRRPAFDFGGPEGP